MEYLHHFKSRINVLQASLPQLKFVPILQIKLSAALCRARKLSPEVAALICGGQPDEVVIPDCTQLKEDDFVAVLQQLSTGRSVYRRSQGLYVCLLDSSMYTKPRWQSLSCNHE